MNGPLCFSFIFNLSFLFIFRIVFFLWLIQCIVWLFFACVSVLCNKKHKYKKYPPEQYTRMTRRYVFIRFVISEFQNIKLQHNLQNQKEKTHHQYIKGGNFKTRNKKLPPTISQWLTKLIYLIKDTSRQFRQSGKHYISFFLWVMALQS